MVSDSKYQTSSNDIRYLLNGVSFEMFRDNPFVGVGAGNYGVRLNDYRAKYAEKNPDSPYLAAGEEVLLERAHNEYLQVLAELGIVGLLFYLFAFGLITRLLILKAHRAESMLESAFPIGALAALASFAVSSLASSFSFRAMQTGIVVFVVIGIGLYSFDRPNRMSKGRVPFLVVIGALLMLLIATIKPVDSIVAMTLTGNPEKPANESALSFLRIVDRDNANIGVAIAQEKMQRGDFFEAALDLEETIRYAGGTIALYHLTARTYEKDDKLGRAVRVMKTATKVYPRSAYAFTYLAYLQKKDKQPAAAEKSFEKALEIDAKTAKTWKSVFEEGTLEASIAAREDENLIKLPDLHPKSVVKMEINEKDR